MYIYIFLRDPIRDSRGRILGSIDQGEETAAAG